MRKTPTVVSGILLGLMVFGSIPMLHGQETQSSPKTGRNWTITLSPATQLDMVWIPPGNFAMGSPTTEPMSKRDEHPQTQVTLSKGFWIGKTIFTIGDWKAATGLGVREQLVKTINNDTLYDLGGKQQTVRDFMRFSQTADATRYMAGEGDDLPMYFVSWNDAMELCKTLTQRERAAGRLPDGYEYNLPTEAQFEYACRAGITDATYAGPLVMENGRYPVLDKVAWFSGNSTEGYTGRGFRVSGKTGGPHPVGQKQPNAWGLYDMVGNIWQWTRDWYAPLPGGNLTDPTGPTTGTGHVNKGGSFGSGADAERSASRASNPAAEASAYRGFRLALCPVQ